MANTTSANLKLTIQTTGENSGTWGSITNTNLVVLEQSVAGYSSIAVNATTGHTLTFSNGIKSDGKNKVLKFTGTPTADINITVPDSIEKTYVVQDSTNHGGNDVTFKTSSGTGIKLCEGHTYTLYSDGTNVLKADEQKVWRVITDDETVQAGAQILASTNTTDVVLTLPASPSTGDEVTIVDQTYNFNTTALTVARNGSNIVNAAQDLTVGVQGAAFTLVYSGDATVGWTYKDK